jgi:hypothetical protein
MSDAVLRDFCKWLAATPLSETIQTAGWIIPTLQTIHILGVAVLFSSAIVLDLRLWRPVLLILLITGSLLIIGEPRRSLLNTTFYLKMTVLAVALTLTGVLQWWLSSAPEAADKDWERDRGRRIAGRIAATVSILVWSGVLFAGRWIAYTQVE